MTNLLMNIFKLSLWGTLTAIVLVLLKKMLTNRISPITQYGLWFVLILRLCIPIFSAPADTASISSQNSYLSSNALHQVDNEPQNSQKMDQAENRMNILELGDKKINFYDIPIASIIECVYFAGLILSLSIFSYTNLKERRSWEKIELHENLIGVLNKYPQITPSNIMIADCDSPHLAGIFLPKIILPRDFLSDDIPRDVLDSIIQHELAHWSQGDLWTYKLIAVLQSVHWFNPVLWIAFREMREDAEVACDTRVMYGKTQQQRIQYGSALLFVAKQSFRSGNTALSFSHHPLKKRIATVLSGKELPKHYIVRACALPIIISIIFLSPNFFTKEIRSVPWILKEDGLYVLTDNQTFSKTNFPLQELSEDETSDTYVYADDFHIIVLSKTEKIKLLISLDNGDTWKTSILPYNYPDKVFMGFSSEQNGWMLLENSSTEEIDHIFLTTSDSGDKWIQKELPLELRSIKWNDFLFANQNYGYVCSDQEEGDCGRLYQTKDGGKTWNQIDLPAFIVSDSDDHLLDIENFNDTLLLTVATVNSLESEANVKIQKYISSNENPEVWKECDKVTEERFLNEKSITLISNLGYKLTLPYFWNGHIYNKPVNEQIFALYESYNYNIQQDENDERYGYVFSIRAIPLAGASQNDRMSQFVIGEDDKYYFVINESGGINCAHDPLAEGYYRMVSESYSWIFQQFATANNLKVNQACYIFE